MWRLDYGAACKTAQQPAWTSRRGGGSARRGVATGARASTARRACVCLLCVCVAAVAVSPYHKQPPHQIWAVIVDHTHHLVPMLRDFRTSALPPPQRHCPQATVDCQPRPVAPKRLEHHHVLAVEVVPVCCSERPPRARQARACRERLRPLYQPPLPLLLGCPGSALETSGRRRPRGLRPCWCGHGLAAPLALDDAAAAEARARALRTPALHTCRAAPGAARFDKRESRAPPGTGRAGVRPHHHAVAMQRAPACATSSPHGLVCRGRCRSRGGRCGGGSGDRRRSRGVDDGGCQP